MRRLYLLIPLFILLAACAKEKTAGDAVEAYLKAKVKSNADDMVNLSCNEWEAQARADSASFASVRAELEDLSCRSDGKDGDYTLVRCEGRIVVEYRGEPRPIELNATTYRAIREDGEWRMCGEETPAAAPGDADATVEATEQP
jgi:hypothetical protein